MFHLFKKAKWLGVGRFIKTECYVRKKHLYFSGKSYTIYVDLYIPERYNSVSTSALLNVRSYTGSELSRGLYLWAKGIYMLIGVMNIIISGSWMGLFYF